MIKKISYLYAKFVLFLQIPSLWECEISKKSKVGSRSNLIRVTMDDYSYVGVNNSICDTNIGKYCSIASYCAIGGGEHPINYVSTSPHFYREVENLDIERKVTEIGHDVWIGEKCFIKSGVKIGNGSIIGAHSVVTKDVPEYSIVVGTPAKVLRYRFNKEICRKLSEIEWWNLPYKVLCNYSIDLKNPDKFIENINER